MPANTPTNYANVHARTVVDYGADPADAHARGLFQDMLDRVQGWLVAPWLGADEDPSLTYGGRLEGVTVQNFIGAADPASTQSVYRDGGHATISSGIVEGPMGDPARRIFADRLRRRSTLP